MLLPNTVSTFLTQSKGTPTNIKWSGINYLTYGLYITFFSSTFCEAGGMGVVAKKVQVIKINDGTLWTVN